MLNAKQGPIEDAEIEDFLRNKPFNFKATYADVHDLVSQFHYNL